ncbi:hypothetical protein [Rhizobium sp. FKL33]|nr:hypothetical protein [Rhizobium sp. FKL33]
MITVVEYAATYSLLTVVRKDGEYRTRRLVLEAWDRMEANGEFSAMGM